MLRLALQLILILAFFSCGQLDKRITEKSVKESYEEEDAIEKAILKAGERYDSNIFMGTKLGMDKKDFYQMLDSLSFSDIVQFNKDEFSYLLRTDFDTFRFYFLPEFIDDKLNSLSLQYDEKRPSKSAQLATMEVASVFMQKYRSNEGWISRTTAWNTHQQICYSKSLKVDVFETFDGVKIVFSDVINQYQAIQYQKLKDELEQKRQFDAL